MLACSNRICIMLFPVLWDCDDDHFLFCVFVFIISKRPSGCRRSRNWRNAYTCYVSTCIDWIYSSMYVCMFVCMYVCLFVCMYVCMYVLICMYVCMYVCMHNMSSGFSPSSNVNYGKAFSRSVLHRIALLCGTLKASKRSRRKLLV